MSTFRIGLSAAFTRADGKPTFPSCDWSTLAGASDIEVEQMQPANTLTPEVIAGYDALVLMGEKVTADSFRDDDRLKLITRMGVGFDRIDVPACTERDVALTITPDGVRRPMASSVVLMILALAHRLVEKDRVTRTGPLGWPARLDFFGVGLVDKTLAIVGLGNIGREVVRLIRAFDMRIIAHDPYIDPKIAEELGVTLVDLDTAFRQADFLSFNCPLNDETRGIGSAEGMAKMKPTAYLVNTSRGPVVDQKALYQALVEGRLAGAAIDVFDPEPSPADDPILKLNNVIVTPHAIGFSDQMFSTMGEVNTRAILAVKGGQSPDNLVNPEVVNRAGFQKKLGR
ncbi:MAG: NAD(P)-dependent oxidoreductase [Proteobacteria bacterium]|nr:NAD(P)-dependent oxidoreductase [Pseudomonadota bacterium]